MAMQSSCPVPRTHVRLHEPLSLIAFSLSWSNTWSVSLEQVHRCKIARACGTVHVLEASLAGAQVLLS